LASFPFGFNPPSLGEFNAKAIIKKFGGQTTLASLIGKGQSTIAYWAKTGSIPARWHPRLLTLAMENGIELSANDLIIGIDEISNNQTQEQPIESLTTDLAPTIEIDSQNSNIETSPFLFYASSDGSIRVQVLVEDETVWASQKGMSDIFDVDVRTISEHLKNIFKTNELEELSVIRKFRITASDGKNYDTSFYSLDAIISVGYRVNSLRATQFRRWATSVLGKGPHRNKEKDNDYKIRNMNSLWHEYCNS
jgi:hypothetical protein